MTEWREVVLGDLCDRITVGHVGKMVDEYVAEGVPFLRSQNVTPFAINRKGMLYINEQFHQRLAKSALRTGDVVVIRTGYPGTAAVIPPNLDNSNCADLVVITPSDQLNPYMLAAVFNSTWGRSAVGGQLVGSAQQHFNIGSARALRIRLPGRDEQDRIAAILCALTDLIENNRQRIELLEQMAQAIYREWFVEFRYPGYEDISLVDSGFGPIPQGWGAGQLRDVVELVYGKALKADDRRAGSVAVYGSGGVVGWHDTALVPGPGIIVGRKGTVGSVYWSDGPFFPIDTTYYVKSTLPLAFIYFALRDLEFVDSHAAVPGLSRDQAYGLPFLVPSAEVCNRFDKIISPIFDLRRTLRIATENFQSTRDLLLPRLISGEIDVSKLDLDSVVDSV
jgi:type I restriction enzyme S subunit